MPLTPAEKLYAKLAAQQAEEARTLDKEARLLEQSRARARVLDRQLREARRMIVGQLAEDAGLLSERHLALTDDERAALCQGFTLLATLLRKGHLAWAIKQHEPDPETEAEIQALIEGHVTLVVTDDAGVPLTNGRRP